MPEQETLWASEDEKRAEFHARTLPVEKNPSRKIFLDGNHTGDDYLTSEQEWWNYLRFMYGEFRMGN